MRTHRLLPLASLLAATFTLLAGCGVVPPGTGTGTGSSVGTAAKARAQLDSLTVAKVLSMRGYSRDRFPHWRDQGNGCDTRDVVLKRDGKNVHATADCKIVSGTWFSRYDGVTYTDPKKLDIDHVVPLANAWRSGAKNWTDDRRGDFANDLDRPQLLAVSLTQNRAKGDQDPSQWKPSSHAEWCDYAIRWIAVKHYWQLTVTQAEKTALIDMLATCPAPSGTATG
ncbi:MAG TPA: HNH endonuclease family protein [Micromonosporaceae bacterium]